MQSAALEIAQLLAKDVHWWSEKNEKVPRLWKATTKSKMSSFPFPLCQFIMLLFKTKKSFCHTNPGARISCLLIFLLCSSFFFFFFFITNSMPGQWVEIREKIALDMILLIPLLQLMNSGRLCIWYGRSRNRNHAERLLNLCLRRKTEWKLFSQDASAPFWNFDKSTFDTWKVFVYLQW